MPPTKRNSLNQRIDDINNHRFEEEYNQLFSELTTLKARREKDRVRVEDILERLGGLQKELDRYKKGTS